MSDIRHKAFYVRESLLEREEAPRNIETYRKICIGNSTAYRLQPVRDLTSFMDTESYFGRRMHFICDHL